MKCRGNSLSRCNFLTVGAIAGLGVTLADFLSMRQARAEQKHYDFIDAKADSVIHIFLAGRDRSPGIVRPQTVFTDRVPR